MKQEGRGRKRSYGTARSRLENKQYIQLYYYCNNLCWSDTQAFSSGPDIRPFVCTRDDTPDPETHSLRVRIVRSPSYIFQYQTLVLCSNFPDTINNMAQNPYKTDFSKTLKTLMINSVPNFWCLISYAVSVASQCFHFSVSTLEVNTITTNYTNCRLYHIFLIVVIAFYSNTSYNYHWYIPSKYNVLYLLHTHFVLQSCL